MRFVFPMDYSIDSSLLSSFREVVFVQTSHISIFSIFYFTCMFVAHCLYYYYTGFHWSFSILFFFLSFVGRALVFFGRVIWKFDKMKCNLIRTKTVNWYRFQISRLYIAQSLECSHSFYLINCMND